VGPFARGGKSRVLVQAADHDFAPAATVTPVGILLPTLGELFVYGVTSKVTSDCLVDRLAQWWGAVRERFAHITTLVINLDNLNVAQTMLWSPCEPPTIRLTRDQVPVRAWRSSSL